MNPKWWGGHCCLHQNVCCCAAVLREDKVVSGRLWTGGGSPAGMGVGIGPSVKDHCEPHEDHCTLPGAQDRLLTSPWQHEHWRSTGCRGCGMSEHWREIVLLHCMQNFNEHYKLLFLQVGPKIQECLKCCTYGQNPCAIWVKGLFKLEIIRQLLWILLILKQTNWLRRCNPDFFFFFNKICLNSDWVKKDWRAKETYA